MDLADIIKERKSIRAFKSDPVPREKVEEVLGLAIRAPSAINLQPWELTVVMDEERAKTEQKTAQGLQGEADLVQPRKREAPAQDVYRPGRGLL